MKKILAFILFVLINNYALAAGGDSGGSSNETVVSEYDSAVKLIKRAGKLEKKEKIKKAKKLYTSAFKKLKIAHRNDKDNPDILNYMGYASRKIGNFTEAENYYLQGLSLDPKHNGINEYLGELYVQTDRIEKANERLAILKNCKCEEYKELELIIKTRGSKVY